MMGQPPPGLLGDVMAALDLSTAVEEAVDNFPRPGAPPWRVGVAAAELDAHLGDMWARASDGGRRDVLTAMAERAVRAGVDPVVLEAPDDAGATAYLAGAGPGSAAVAAAGAAARADRHLRHVDGVRLVGAGGREARGGGGAVGGLDPAR